MNALVVSWRLRTDLLAILAAAAPRQSDCASESRLVSAPRVRRHRVNSTLTKLTPRNAMDELVEHESSSDVRAADARVASD